MASGSLTGAHLLTKPFHPLSAVRCRPGPALTPRFHVALLCGIKRPHGEGTIITFYKEGTAHKGAGHVVKCYNDTSAFQESKEQKEKFKSNRNEPLVASVHRQDEDQSTGSGVMEKTHSMIQPHRSSEHTQNLV